MVRPTKEGLEYFPIDIGIENDDKLLAVIGKFGTLGFGIIVRLMAEIYKNGYYYPWTEREHYTFSSRISVDVNTILAVVSECIKWVFSIKNYMRITAYYRLLDSKKGISQQLIGGQRMTYSLSTF